MDVREDVKIKMDLRLFVSQVKVRRRWRERESLRGQTDCEKGKRSGCASGKKKKKLSRRKGSTKTTRTKPAREGRRKNKSIHALQKGKTNRDNAC